MDMKPKLTPLGRQSPNSAKCGTATVRYHIDDCITFCHEHDQVLCGKQNGYCMYHLHDPGCRGRMINEFLWDIHLSADGTQVVQR